MMWAWDDGPRVVLGRSNGCQVGCGTMDDPPGGVVLRAPGRLSGARVLVTGGIGFFGSNAVHRLVDEGASVVVVESLVPDHGGGRDDLPTGASVDLYLGDIGDEPVVDAVAADADAVLNIRRGT